MGILDMGPSTKDVRTRGGRGVSQKRTHADAGGEGGQWQKADVLKFKFLPKFCSLNSVLCAKKQHLPQQLII